MAVLNTPCDARFFRFTDDFLLFRCNNPGRPRTNDDPNLPGLEVFLEFMGCGFDLFVTLRDVTPLELYEEARFCFFDLNEVITFLSLSVFQHTLVNLDNLNLMKFRVLQIQNRFCF